VSQSFILTGHHLAHPHAGELVGGVEMVTGADDAKCGLGSYYRAYRRPGGQSATRTAIAGRMCAARRAGPRVTRSEAIKVALMVIEISRHAIGNGVSKLPNAGLFR
jgi:hypothetical protein